MKLSIMIVLFAALLVPTSADAHYDFDPLPDVPGVGDPSALAGPAPSIEVSDRTARLRPDHLVSVAMRCVTSSDVGCEGGVELSDRDGLVLAAAPVSLEERLVEWVHFKLKRADHFAGSTLTARARVSDGLGRVAEDEGVIRLRPRRDPSARG